MKSTTGSSLQSFTMKDGLPGDDNNTFMEDKSGKLWIGTRGTACFYDGKTFTVLKSKNGKTFTNVWSIFEDKKGNIWFGDTDGLWRYDGPTFTHVSQKGAYAIIQDKEGNIWTTGSNGSAGRILKDSSGRAVWAFSRYDHKSLYSKQPEVTEIMTGPPAFLGLLEAKDGSIWFGTMGPTNWVYRYDPRLPDGQGNKFTAFKSAGGSNK